MLYPIVMTSLIRERKEGPLHAPKRLIVHGDDFGLCASVNSATVAALESGALSSASIMVPCAGFREAAAFAAHHPKYDIGIHLTITNEWPRYDWGPVAPQQLVSSLTDPRGRFLSTVGEVSRKAKPNEVEIELCAQIELAMSAGILPTHIDTHMFALLDNPRLYCVYANVAQKFNLPFVVLRDSRYPASEVNTVDPVVHTIFIAYPTLAPARWEAAYTRTLELLDNGVSQIIVHVGYDNAELRNNIGIYSAFGSVWRERDFNVIRSSQFRETLQKQQIKLTSWSSAAAKR